MYKYIKALASRAETNIEPKHYLVIRGALIGIFIATFGFALEYYFKNSVTHFISGLGVLIGFISVAYGLLISIKDSHDSYKEDKEKEIEFKNRKQPWE